MDLLLQAKGDVEILKERRGHQPCLSAKHRWGKFAQWNLGGQKPWLLDITACDADVIAVQELAREESGWQSFETKEFHWIAHRAPEQWRAVGLAISLDRFDCVLHKIATSRGIWAVVRLRDIGRVLLGSMHCHTGVTNLVYQGAVREFFHQCPRRFRHLPTFCGIDANEVPTWELNEADQGEFASGSSNLSDLVHAASSLGLAPLCPCWDLRTAATHFPRDSSRRGRQIDMIFVKQLHLLPFDIDADRRLCIGSDHALLHGDLIVASSPLKVRWYNDSRPRWVNRELPDDLSLKDEDELREIARRHSRPKPSSAYRDTPEVLEAIRQARLLGSAAAWKHVHRLRKECRAKWKDDRLADIIAGNWDQYRSLQNDKKRVRGWWGDLLKDKTAEELTSDVTAHLEKKMVDPHLVDWDASLGQLISEVDVSVPFAPFCKIDVRTELLAMRCRSAVGPDGVSVHLLRVLVDHDTLGDQFLDLINRVVEEGATPASWSQSFLALLAKIPLPQAPSDLRPICVSSAFNKLVSRLICARALPVLRRPSRVSCCGKGRQAADLIGAASRIRDVSKEWRRPLLVAKLDVAGAFDRLDRKKVAEFLLSRLAASGLPRELQYLLRQLQTHQLTGVVPGGHKIDVFTNVGIRQGAPESAEVFGLVIDAMLSELCDCHAWKALGKPLDELDVTLLMYQDDIFLFEDDLGRLCKRIRVVDRCLRRAGLCLATSKTKIVANEYYTGARAAAVGDDRFSIAPAGESVKVLGLPFDFSADASQQARELISRTRQAAASHRDILQGRGSWTNKLKILRTLVESQFTWTAGALCWSATDLQALNTLQLQTCRAAFGLRRLRDESWVAWNSRSLRFVRVWLHNARVTRWSTRVLELEHMLHGHWARQVESDPLTAFPSAPMRALLWRNMYWWRQQQSLSPSVGMRHPGRFYAANTERQLAQVHGTLWHVIAQDRERWSSERKTYVDQWDVRWCQGRQLALRY